MNFNIHGNCPECGKSWDAGDIPKERRKNYLPPYKYSKLVGIELQGGYDGISFWQCPFCKAKWDRFTKKLVEKGE